MPPEPNSHRPSLDEMIAATGGLRPLATQPVQVDIHEADGIYIRQIHAPQKDTLLEQHAHIWDHVTLIAAGAAYLWRNGELYPGLMRAPRAVVITAGDEHAFLTAEDNTILYCIHNLTHGDKPSILKSMGLLSED